MFFVDAVADLADFVVGAFIGNIFMIIREAGSIKNQVAVNMFLSVNPFIEVRAAYTVIFLSVLFSTCRQSMYEVDVFFNSVDVIQMLFSFISTCS